MFKYTQTGIRACTHTHTHNRLFHQVEASTQTTVLLLTSRFTLLLLHLKLFLLLATNNTCKGNFALSGSAGIWLSALMLFSLRLPLSLVHCRALLLSSSRGDPSRHLSMSPRLRAWPCSLSSVSSMCLCPRQPDQAQDGELQGGKRTALLPVIDHTVLHTNPLFFKPQCLSVKPPPRPPPSSAAWR